MRVGYLVAPNVLSYVNGGYSGSHWSARSLLQHASPALPVGDHTNSFNRNGWFVGGGVENNLNIFGISAPGWFMKTEYRAAYFDKKAINELTDGANALDRSRHQLQALGPDHQHLAGLSLQLDRPGGRQVLISSLWNSKAPATCRGFFVGCG